MEGRPKIISADDAAKILGVSSKRIRVLINEKRLHAQFVGNSWVLFEEDVKEFSKHKRKTGRPRK